MNYSLFVLPRVQRALAGLPREDYDRVKSAIARLAENPRPAGCQKLAGRDGWRVRVGDYRIIYEIDGSVRSVTVLDVGHRREVYR
ncbi:MAG TPA: type II toxin-antitoxin system RelE/ParE family toxin [Candidatus Acidoferrales bacterium]|nr:type II toxin-antitoxin system RelE/ParE family toxin [Candidatus Acidoferrales bacterium]